MKKEISNNKKVEIDIYDLVVNGTFGEVKTGMPREEILSVFPEPDDWMHGYNMKRSPIWRYGNFELHFEKDTLSFIYNDYLSNISGGKSLNINRWIFNGDKNFTLKDISEELNQLDIKFEVIVSEYNTRLYVPQSNVELIFNKSDLEDDEEILTSIVKK